MGSVDNGNENDVVESENDRSDEDRVEDNHLDDNGSDNKGSLDVDGSGSNNNRTSND